MTEAQSIAALSVPENISKQAYDANTILYANTDDTPVALTVGASKIIGRKATGDIGALTLSEVLDLVGSAADGDMLIRSGGAWIRLAKGTNGQFLKMVSGLPAWSA